MRYSEVKDVKRYVETKVICDDCGKECTNTNIELLFKFSFSERIDHAKDICYDCWEKKYKKEWNDQKEKDFNDLINKNKKK